MNKEFLNQLKYYLNTNLQLQCTAMFRPKEGSKPSIKGADATLTADIYADISNGIFDSIGFFKPLVRPLCTLVNDMYADGKMINPYNEIFEGGAEVSKENKLNTIEYWINYDFTQVDFNLKTWQRLLDLNFDVFNWIKSGHANDINALQYIAAKRLPIAVITTSLYKYKLWLKSQNLTGENHIMICKKADMRGRMFSKIELGYDWEKSEQGTVSMAHARTKEEDDATKKL